jgi:hypothetical protein
MTEQSSPATHPNEIHGDNWKVWSEVKSACYELWY